MASENYDQNKNDKDRLLILQRQLTVGVLSLVMLFLLFYIGGIYADIIRILGISLLLSYLLINFVDFLEKHLRSRAAAITIVYLVLFALIIVGCVLVIPSVVYQISQLLETLWNKFPDWIQALTQALALLESRLHAARIPFRTIDIVSSFAASYPRPEPSVIFDRVGFVAVSTMTWLLYGISILVTTFYFLLDGHNMKDWIIRLFPHRHQKSMQVIAKEMDKNLQAFFRGQVILGMGAGIIMLFIYLALGVHYALLLSIFLAIWEIVPVIGPPIGFFPAIFAVGVSGMDNFPVNHIVQIVFLTIVFIVMQQIKDNVIAPRYIGNVIGIHPILIFIAIMVGARVDGLTGIIFALPVACVINVLINHSPLNPAWSSASPAAVVPQSQDSAE